jgi:hypothetical protein
VGSRNNIFDYKLTLASGRYRSRFCKVCTFASDRDNQNGILKKVEKSQCRNT